MLGCVRRPRRMRKRRVPDLTGKCSGNLTVIGRAAAPSGGNPKHTVWWECSCSCDGKSVIWHTHYFIRSRRPSCGCAMQRGKRLGVTTDSAFNAIIRAYKQGASLSERVWNLSDSQAEKLFKGNCTYCNAAPCTVKRAISGKTFTYNGIDRLDNNIGYVPENCVSCCRRCNYAKSTHSVDNFLAWVASVYKHTNRAKGDK